jgi:hypothetical protein
LMREVRSGFAGTGFERVETLVEDPGDAAIEPDRGTRDALEQPAVGGGQRGLGRRDAPRHPKELQGLPRRKGRVL